MKLSGKVAIVTGAGGGIGRAAALPLATHGVGLVLVSRTREKLAETARFTAAAVAAPVPLYAAFYFNTIHR